MSCLAFCGIMVQAIICNTSILKAVIKSKRILKVNSGKQVSLVSSGVYQYVVVAPKTFNHC